MNRILVTLAAIGLVLPLLAAPRQRYTISTDGAPRAAALRIATSAENSAVSQRVRTFRNLHGFAADLTPEEVEALRAMPGVRAVEPVVERRATAVADLEVPSNLVSYAKQVTPWGLTTIHAADVWPFTRGEGINVVVLDTGIDLEHPDLQAAYVGGHNILDPTKPPADDNFHGTHVAGIIAATNNAFGTVGAAPGVRLWAVKGLDKEGKGYDELIAASLDWIISKSKEVGGRWVVNMSFGAGAEGGSLERAAVERALAQNIVLVASAGNGGSYYLEYPAAYPGVIAVGAVGEDGRKAEFSAYGGRMSFVAPGVGIPSTLPDEFLEESDILVGEQKFSSLGTVGSPKAAKTGRLVYCNLGRPGEFPQTVRDNIALIMRGDNAFREKSRNAREAGAIGVVIINNIPGDPLRPFTLLPKNCIGAECGIDWDGYPFPLTVNVTYEDGQKLLQLANQPATVAFEFVRYGPQSGTSMAAPHVAATAALMLGLDATLRWTEIGTILRATAADTADEGWDYETAWGIVDALAAAKWVAPEKFGAQPPPPSRRRSARP